MELTRCLLLQYHLVQAHVEPFTVPFVKRRLLFLLPFAPRLDGLHGGARASAQLLLSLSMRHSVAVLYLRDKSQLPADPVLQRNCDLVEEIISPEHADAESMLPTLKMWTSLLWGTPRWVNDASVAAYAERVRKIAQVWKPDIVQMEFHVMAQYQAALEGCPAPRILTQYDPGVQAAQERLRSDQREGLLLPYLDLLAWKRFERESMKHADAVVVFTDRDRQVVAPYADQTPIVTIPLGTDIPKHALNPRGDLKPNILFIGSFRHWPNIDAASYLAHSIFPRVRELYPELRLYIVGDHPPRQLRALDSEHVVVTGRVADVTPFLDGASIVAIPLRYGGGMRVKVLEALAAGKALVATPRALEGLAITDREQVRIAHDEHEFSDALIQLLAEPDTRAQMASCARVWASTHLRWDKSVAAYEALYDQLLC